MSQFRCRKDQIPVNWSNVAEHLSQHGFTLDPSIEPRQFKGGLANVNYLLQVDEAEVVLRTAPPGPLPAGAHDMVREYRVLSRLWADFSPAPRAFHLCEEEQVIGRPFFLMQYRSGMVIGHEMPRALIADSTDAVRLGVVIEQNLLDLMIALHSVEPRSVDLESLGRPERFFDRQLAAWGRAAKNVRLRDDDIESVCAWLMDNRPVQGPATLIHNDFKIDNMAFDPDTMTPVALFDWDLCTRADPLFDLAVLLSYWEEQDDVIAMRELRQQPTKAYGFSNRAGLIQHYASKSGSNLQGLQAYRILAMLRLSVVFAQLAHSERNQNQGQIGDFAINAARLLSFAVAMTREKSDL